MRLDKARPTNRLVSLLTLLLLVVCVLMDQEEAFELRPPRRKRQICVRSLERCSRRRSKRETKADIINPLDMNDAWTILIGVPFISSKTFSKSHYMALASRITVKERTETNK